MDSYDWKIMSEIFLGIGIVLLIAALIIAIRYRVISNMISDLKVGKMSPEPFRTPSAITLSLRSTDAGLSAPPESDEDGPWTVVVAQKQEDSTDGTVVVGNNKSAESDFVITSNIVVINADVDSIDNGRKK